MDDLNATGLEGAAGEAEGLRSVPALVTGAPWALARTGDCPTVCPPVDKEPAPHPSGKFDHPIFTANGERRARVALSILETLWFNTGTLCNLTCANCYIESSPTNDRLAYLSRAEVRDFLDQAMRLAPRPTEIGFTGGEPFMNPDLVGMIEDCLEAGFRVLILTNAMKPMRKVDTALSVINARFPGQMTVRVSLDHYTANGHEHLRGINSWVRTIEGLRWLAANRFKVTVAGRTVWGEDEAAIRAGYARLFGELGLALDAYDPLQLVLFPEMDIGDDVPEITEQCWGILGKSPDSIMCANSRMVVRRNGADRAMVVACTLLPYESAFELGPRLADAFRPVSLNHPHCAKFCVLGGASCSPRKDT